MIRTVVGLNVLNSRETLMTYTVIGILVVVAATKHLKARVI